MKYPHWISNRLNGQDVHIVASGPSLSNFDYSYFDDKNVITTNHSYKKVKKSLWNVSVDRGFIAEEDAQAPLNTILLSRADPRYPQIIDFEFSEKLTNNPHDGVYTRKHSGAAAITTALHAGANMIYLWGFDCCYIEGKAHSTENEFNHRKTEPEKNARDADFHKSYAAILSRKIPYYSVFPMDKIINMSLKSAIPYFEKRSI